MGRNPEVKKLKDIDLDDNLSVPNDKNRKNLNIILKENSGCVFKWVNKKDYRFTLDEHAYFNSSRGQAYITDNRIAVNIYFEGIPVPMHHSYIKTKKVTKEITTLDGTTETISFEKISGVDVDSQVIHYLLDRGLADEFTERKDFGVSSGLHILLTIGILILSIMEIFQI